MKISDIVQQPEGRRLEFKEILPMVAALAKTMVAFANDAGGDLYIGIKNDPRALTGLPEDDLLIIEEQISNIIYDYCYPIIIPEISFHTIDNLHFIKVHIYRGSNLPYYLKSKGKLNGTYIRVGSTNRLANEEIIAELERQKRNISIDAEPVFEKTIDTIDISNFKAFYLDKTGENLDENTLRKLDLIKEQNGSKYPNNACILFSEDPLRKTLFPYAKVECARFKGITIDEFIDQKTIDTHIAVQAELAYDFVLRHINKGASVKGVYTETRWEYPVKAVREAIRNAVVHRDYSLTGKDIKVAIYDDMVEITSPGKLMPSIDFNEMEARQSDIRNKVIAPVFKRLGIIDQWGNGLKLIADELKDYPEIEFKWFEKGLQFQVQFVNKNYKQQIESQPELQPELQLELKEQTLYSKVLEVLASKISSKKEVSEKLGQKEITGRLNVVMNKLVNDGMILRTIPKKPSSSKQQYYLSEKGKAFLSLIQNNSNNNI